MTTHQANKVEGGNEMLNNALVISQQVALLIPTVGVLLNAGTALVRAIQSNRNADAATAQQAREAIANFRMAAQELSAATTDALERLRAEEEAEG